MGERGGSLPIPDAGCGSTLAVTHLIVEAFADRLGRGAGCGWVSPPLHLGGSIVGARVVSDLRAHRRVWWCAVSWASVFVAAGVAVWALGGMRLAASRRRGALSGGGVVWQTAAGVCLFYGGAAVAGGGGGYRLAAMVAGALCCAAAMFAVHVARPAWAGPDEVRLCALNGLVCGWWGPLAALAALAAGAVFAAPQALNAAASAVGGGDAPVRSALGPGLTAGAAAVIAYRVAASISR